MLGSCSGELFFFSFYSCSGERGQPPELICLRCSRENAIENSEGVRELSLIGPGLGSGTNRASTRYFESRR